MIFAILFETFFYFAYSNDEYPKTKALVECPAKDRGYEHIEQELSSYAKKNYYVCNKKMKNPIKLTENILLIYHCNFTNTASPTVGSIYIVATEKAILASIEIHNCYFYETQRESIHIKTKTRYRAANICDCIFEKCVSPTEASAIYFKVTSGKIERCTFLNNENKQNPAGSDIFYEYITDTQTGKVVFNENSFIRKALNSKGSIITFKYGSLFDFTNNLISISKESTALLFKWPSELTTINKYKFEGNKIFPANENAIKTPKNLIKNKFENLTHECPPDSIQQGDLIDNMCDLPFINNSKAIEISQSLVNIFHCSFYSNANKHNFLGGAIYFSLDQNFPYYDEPIRIHNSDFVSNSAKEGGAIYIDCKKQSFLFDFIDCYFSNNYYFDSSNPNVDYNDKKGGSIYISTKFSSFSFTRCSFENNIAGDGGAIYYISDTSDVEEAKDDKNKYSLYLIDCKFNHNQIKSFGGGLYVSLIGHEHSKPIEIESCIFLKNTASDNDETDEELPEKGAAIYCSHSCTDLVESTIEHFFRVINCYFKSNVATYNGGAISFYIEKKEPSRCFEIHNCSFMTNSVTNNGDKNKYMAGTGADIDFVFDCSSYSTSSSNWKVVHINECDFYNSKALLQGGAISVQIQNVEPSKSIEIDHCNFTKGIAEIGGAINYRFTASQSQSKVLLDESHPIYSMHVVDCTFTSNQVKYNGGAIAILIVNDEPVNPIEIYHCSFLHNYANDTDPNQEYGGAIFYLYQSTAPLKFKKILETSNYGFGIHNCVFTANEVSSIGGAIFIGFTKVEPSKHVEINNCSFNKNIASLGIAADIYLDLDPQQSSASTKNEYIMVVNECDFTESSAKDHASIYIEIESGQSSRTIEFTKCKFNPIKANGIYLNSKNPSMYFHFDDCNFIDKACIFINVSSAKIENCHFTDMSEIPIYYKSSMETFDSNYELRIEKCEFNQSTEIKSLVYFSTKLSSMFSFVSNNIVITNDKVHVLGCSDEKLINEKGWHFEQNIINGHNEMIKTDMAQMIPTSCENGFICLPECNGQLRCDFNATTTVDNHSIELSNLSFNGLNYKENGAALFAYNYQVYCHDSNFTSCISDGFGGGGIYLYLNVIVDQPIKLENIRFVKCAAVYGGAVFIYSNKDKNLIKILRCFFSENVANKKESVNGDIYYGGSAIFLTSKSGEIKDCIFTQNVGSGLKIFNNFAMSKKGKSVKNENSISISDCVFETGENSLSSIFYHGGSRDEIPVEVKNCIFKGKLDKKNFHIDGKFLFEKNEVMNLHIESCQFPQGFESSIKLEKPGHVLSSNMQTKTDSKEQNKLKIFSITTLYLAFVAVISVFFISFYFSKNKKQKIKDEKSIDL